MERTLKILIAFLLVAMVAIPIAFAEDIIGAVGKEPSISIVYEGKTDIKDTIDSKFSEAEKISAVGVAAESVMTKEVYPYKIEKSEITITKCRFDEKTQTMWYWIEATRNGEEVAVNNPIWIYPAPTEVVVSTSFNQITKVLTVTKKEDPKAAVEYVLKQYVDRMPLGKSVVTEQ
jgi:hypothetical protein